MEFLFPAIRRMGFWYMTDFIIVKDRGIPLFTNATCHDDTFQFFDPFVLYGGL